MHIKLEDPLIDLPKPCRVFYDSTSWNMHEHHSHSTCVSNVTIVRIWLTLLYIYMHFNIIASTVASCFALTYAHAVMIALLEYLNH